MITVKNPPAADMSGAQRTVRAYQQSLESQISKLVNATLDEILAEAKKRTPVSEEGSHPTNSPGALRRSGKKIKERGETKGSVQFGDENAPYAVYVHENLGFNKPSHRVGEGKFLENAVDEVLPEFFARLKLICEGKSYTVSESMEVAGQDGGMETTRSNTTSF